MTKKSKEDNPLLGLALVGALGIQVAVCIFLGYWAGAYISDRSGNSGWVVGGVMFGLTVGIVSAILVVKKVLEDSNG